jgi:hypothetical protein
MPDLIAKQTPQTREHPLDFRLTARHPQENQRHLGNGEKGDTLTEKTEAERALSHPELSGRLLREEVEHGEVDSPCMIERMALRPIQEQAEMLEERSDQGVDDVGVGQRAPVNHTTAQRSVPREPFSRNETPQDQWNSSTVSVNLLENAWNNDSIFIALLAQLDKPLKYFRAR